MNCFFVGRNYLSTPTVYPKKYAHGFVVLCFVVVMQSLIMNSHEVFIHIHQGCFAGSGAIVRLPQCQWSKPDGYGKISQCITTTKHTKVKPCAYFLGYTVGANIYTMNPGTLDIQGSRARLNTPRVSVGSSDWGWIYMMTSWNGNIFRVTGHLCWEFIGHRWIFRTKASDVGLWFLLGCAPE